MGRIVTIVQLPLVQHVAEDIPKPPRPAYLLKMPIDKSHQTPQRTARSVVIFHKRRELITKMRQIRNALAVPFVQEIQRPLLGPADQWLLPPQTI